RQPPRGRNRRCAGAGRRDLRVSARQCHRRRPGTAPGRLQNEGSAAARARSRPNPGGRGVFLAGPSISTVEDSRIMATVTRPRPPPRPRPAGAVALPRQTAPGAPAESDSAVIERLFEEIRRMSDEHNRGEIDAAVPVDRFEGKYRGLAEAINGMVAGHIAVKK